MKNWNCVLFKIFFLLFIISFNQLNLKANVQLLESFTSPNFPTTTFTTGTFTLSSGLWDAKNVMGLETINAYNGSGQGAKLERYLEAYLTTPVLNTAGTISFYYRNFSSLLGGGSFVVQKSVNNGAFTDLATVNFSSTSSYTSFSYNLNESNSNVRIRIFCSATNGNSGYLCIDEFMVTDLGQTLATNPAVLNEINYYVGQGPSAAQSFNLFGNNLTGAPGNISLVAPADFEISLNNISFASSQNISYTSPTLPNTTVYVRLISGLPIGSYNSEQIVISGGGVSSFSVTCSGNVTSAPLPTLVVNPGVLSGFTYVFGNGPSVIKSYSISGTNLSGYPGNIVVSAPTDYEVSTDYVNYYSSLNVGYSSSNLPSVMIYVRLKAGLPENSYNSEIITNIGGGASSNVVCNGIVTAPPAPALSVTPNLISGFTYVVGSGPSIAQSYMLNGSGLTGAPGNILVTAPANYEVSLNAGSGFGSSLNIPFTGSVLSSTIVYVRLKSGLVVNNYNAEIISNSGGGANTVNVTCNGSVTNPPPPTLMANQTSLSGFSYIVGSGPSTSQTYNLSGSNLTGAPGNITVTAPVDYDISLDNSTFSSSINVPYTSATLSNIPVYVRLKTGLPIGSYNSEIITNTGGGATSVDVTCNGNVVSPPPPMLSANPTSLSGFSYIVGSGPSTSQSYTLSGSNLTGAPGNIALTAPADYELSLNNSTYSSNLNVPYTSSTLANTLVYVRLKSGLSVNSYNSEIITNAGGGATTINVTCNGSVSSQPPPMLSANPTSLTGFTYTVGSGPSASQSYVISGNNLTGAPGNIVITAPADFEISLDNSIFSASLNLPYTSSILASTTIYVRLIAGLAINSYNTENITHSGGGALINIPCSGIVTDVSAICIDEGFANGVTAPANWTFTNIGATYTSAGNYGAASPSLKFDATADRVETSTFTNATELSFWIKGQVATGSSLLVEGFNGSTWSQVDNIVLTTVTTGTTKLYNSGSSPALASGFTKFRFTYTKATGNLSFDDVLVTCGSTVIIPEFKLSENIDVFIFPNPNNGKFEINISGVELKTATIYLVNVLGQIVFEKDVESETINSIPIQVNLETGIYYLQMYIKDTRITKKIVID